MLKVPNRTESNSRSGNQCEIGDSGNGCEKFTDIREANRRVKLIDILRAYGFRIEKNYQRPSWSNNIKCPFPSHKGSNERTASFGYCFKSDHFSCLGCGKAGRAVEFISLYEGVPRHEVADKILNKYGGLDVPTDDFDYNDDIIKVLLDCSSFINKKIQTNKHNKSAIENIDKLIWWIDFYLQAKEETKTLTKEDLEYRVKIVKELLSDEMFDSR